MASRVIFWIFFCLWLPHWVLAEDCGLLDDLRVFRSDSSAAFLANYWKLKGSIGYDAQIGLELAETILNSKNCFTDSQIEFQATPKSFLTVNYLDKEMCEELYVQTLKNPFVFKKPESRNLDQILLEFMLISRGSGVIGSELYERCPGKCSLQYRIELFPVSPGEYQTKLVAICGPARDKSENKYTLESVVKFIPK